MLNENDYSMGEDMPNAARVDSRAEDKGSGRQVAGRDFLEPS